MVGAGVLPYLADRTAIDLLSKNDTTIAHEPMHIDSKVAFYPGHLKWDYDYSIGTLKPDLIVESWTLIEKEIPSAFSPLYTLVRIDGYPLYLRNDSPHVR